MGPSPDTDNTPKAPDKNEKEKTKTDNNQHLTEDNKEKGKEVEKLNNLNDGELKALLEEAVTYKIPKDREGKSELFLDLLDQTEIKAKEEERQVFDCAGGFEASGFFHSSLSRRNKGGRRKYVSVSENTVQGGSLDNISSEFSSPSLIYQPKRNVSSRQQEGGSLPCNVNTGIVTYNFLEESSRRRQTSKESDDSKKMEQQSLLEHDVLAQGYDNREKQVVEEENDDIQQLTLNYTSSATIPINSCGEHLWACSSYRTFCTISKSVTSSSEQECQDVSLSSLAAVSANVDNSISLELERRNDKKNFDADNIQAKLIHTSSNIYTSASAAREGVSISVKQTNTTATSVVEDTTKKVDENDNALQQTATAVKSKKKKLTDKNVIVFDATSVVGHRSDIIDDVDQLAKFIDGSDDVESGTKKKTKQLHNKQHIEDGGKKRQRAHSSKSKEVKSDLKKSNSLGEISSVNTEDFMSLGGSDDKVVLRSNKNGSSERPRERRSWGNVESQPIETLYNNAAMESVETADFTKVIKKKKSKNKQRNYGSTGRRQNLSTEVSSKQTHHRAPSPDIGTGKYYEKSNDSSDVDSVHSLPIDTQHLNKPTFPMTETAINAPVSYADIAKNSDKPKDKKASPDISEKVPKEKTPTKAETETKPKTKTKPQTVVPSPSPVAAVSASNTVSEKPVSVGTVTGTASSAGSSKAESKSIAPPDVHNIKSFPAIQHNNKLHNVSQPTTVEKTSNNNKMGSNKVQKSASVNNRSKNNVQKFSAAGVQTNVQKDTQTGMQKDVQVNVQKDVQANVQKDVEANVQKEVQANVQKDVQANMQKDVQANVQKDVQPNLQKDVQPNLQKDVPSYMQKTVVYRHIQTNVQRDIQTNVQKEVKTSVQKEVKTSVHKDVQTNVQQETKTVEHKDIQTNIQKNVQTNVQPYEHKDIQTDSYVPLAQNNQIASIIQANENESIQYTPKKLPHDIPDVQSIEKMHFMNRQTSQQPYQNPPQQQQQLSLHIQHYQQQQQHVSPSLAMSSHVVVPPPVMPQQQPPALPQHHHHQHQQNISNVPDCDNSSDRTSDIEPVIMVGGQSSREVSGITFGFDVNKRLLLDDMCDNFISRYRPPHLVSSTSHNHNKIVNFIGSAWEDIASSSNVKHYSDDL